MKLASRLHFLAVEAKSLIFLWRVFAKSTHTRAVIMNPVTRHVWLVARHHRFDSRGHQPGTFAGPFGWSFACYAFIRVGIHYTRYWSRNPYKACRTAAEFARWSAWSRPRRMSASISRSRSSMPRNRNPLRRRSRCRRMRTADAERDGSFVAGDSFYCPWIMIHQCTRSRGEFASSLRAEKYQNLTAVGIASNDLAPEWAIGLEAWPVALRVLLDCRSGRAGSR